MRPGVRRIGRAALKIIEQTGTAEVVAVNDLIPTDNLAYLLRYDTVYGRWHRTVMADGDWLTISGRRVPVLARRDRGLLLPCSLRSSRARLPGSRAAACSSS